MIKIIIMNVSLISSTKLDALFFFIVHYGLALKKSCNVSLQFDQNNNVNM